MLWSGKEPAPFLDEHGAVLEGSISEKVRVDINGVPQGTVIRGEDVTDPVLLVVHGGPGMPDYFLTRNYPTDIEDLFTVVWWDQRGTALSYHPDIPAASMTVEQFIEDTLAVTDYLRERFGLWEDEVLRADIPRRVPRLEVPAYFFAGAYDYTTVTGLVEDYYDALDAPAKGSYLFENSAHSPLLEEPQQARLILQDDLLRPPTR